MINYPFVSYSHQWLIAAEIDAMETWLLELIQCPITREPLSLADAELLQILHPLLNESKLLNRQGVKVDEAFEGGLVNASRTWFYPIVQGIPTLVPDEAIPIPKQN